MNAFRLKLLSWRMRLIRWLANGDAIVLNCTIGEDGFAITTGQGQNGFVDNVEIHLTKLHSGFRSQGEDAWADAVGGPGTGAGAHTRLH